MLFLLGRPAEVEVELFVDLGPAAALATCTLASASLSAEEEEDDDADECWLPLAGPSMVLHVLELKGERRDTAFGWLW